MNVITVAKRIATALDDMKALDVRVIDVRKITTIADVIIIASGRSDRHLRALADSAAQTARTCKLRVLGTEGERTGEWVLVDMGDIIVHLMHPTARAYYQLEKLWSNGGREVAVSK
ncbi:MAG: ribosome silencing factor [Gammaproteobacteria bacterium RIFCSPLOWO2_02_FULL_61_13]|nr:MAG: ribosome silencing factor [Gammaproteobacteria bacterium RIFCSPLOWO2_02_FULL_61_13]